jgi:hypothetical protein
MRLGVNSCLDADGRPAERGYGEVSVEALEEGEELRSGCDTLAACAEDCEGPGELIELGNGERRLELARCKVFDVLDAGKEQIDEVVLVRRSDAAQKPRIGAIAE